MNKPVNWIEARLGEVCSVEIGGTPSRQRSDYWDAEHMTLNTWVSIRDMHQRVILDTAERISDAGVKHSNAKLHKKGTVLLSFKLTIGRVAVAGVPLYTNEAIAGLKPITDLTSEYLYHGLQYWDLLQDVDLAIKGATLNKEKLKRITLSFPKFKSEQTKIAEILSTVDQAIEQTDALIAKQQRIKTGLMQDLLTRGIDKDGNLRSEDTHEFKDSPLGRIPLDWKVQSINSISNFVTSGARGWAKYYSHEGAVFLRIGNLTRDHINMRFDDTVFVQPPANAEGMRTAVLPRDVLISVTADLGIVGIIPEDFGEGYVNQHIALVRFSNSEVNQRFIGWFLQSRAGQIQIERLNEAGAKAGLNLPTIRSLLVASPPASEQRHIAQVLDTVTNTISCLQTEKTKLIRLKTALMQDLLTGDVSVTPLIANEEIGV